MFEVGLSKSFRAWHVMPGMEGPEGELHSHDYRLETIVTREALDDNGMVCDLDVLQAALDQVVAHVADKDLELIRPSDAEAVTVEVFARWAHGQISERISGHGQSLSIRVWENPVAFGGYSAPMDR